MCIFILYVKDLVFLCIVCGEQTTSVPVASCLRQTLKSLRAKLIGNPINYRAKLHDIAI